MADAVKPIAYLASGGRLPGRRENVALTLGWAVLLLCVLWSVGVRRCRAEDKPSTKVLFLVARSSILDPFFERSVVLMVPLQGEPLIVGLVVNKPTLLPLLKIFPKSAALKNRSENAYLGGPVDMAAPALAFHTRKPPKQAIPLYDDVYLSFDPKFITKLMQDPKETGELRLFMGRSQWAPAQLQGEALRGSWYSLRAEGEVIFDHDSERLWKRLEERAEAPKSVQEWMPEAPPDWKYASFPPVSLPPGTGVTIDPQIAQISQIYSFQSNRGSERRSPFSVKEKKVPDIFPTFSDTFSVFSSRYPYLLEPAAQLIRRLRRFLRFRAFNRRLAPSDDRRSR